MATIKFVQAQKFSLSGSGSSIGDTTLTLQSFTLPNGTLITTTDLGVKCFGTIEPGNGSQEEQISFTGVTQNSNGTATLTGVNSVSFVSPYTETSGLSKTHAGATTFIISNDAGFYGQILNYIDTAIVSGGVPATTTVLGLQKISVAPASPASPISVGDNDPRVPTQAEKNFLASVRTTSIPYVVATGTASAFTATLASSVQSLASGVALNFRVPTTNASGVTLNVNSLGAAGIKKYVSSTLATGDIVAGQIATVIFDGTNFQLVSPTTRASTLPQIATGTFTKNTANTTTTTVAHGMGLTPRLVEITGSLLSTSSISSAYSIYLTSQKSSSYIKDTTGVAEVDGGTTTFIIGSDPSNYITGAMSVDSTNITITWTATSGTSAGTANFVYKAIE